ncbi:MAG TPA: tetratricopeptide repeat protein [Thermoanaerobaculia bacterium]|nr:tetratricopeptide repeat protein [Thermoanaerobaculia bacterium]
MRRALALGLFLSALAANAYAIGEARFTGKVVDPNGEPLAGVSIEVEATESRTYNETFKTGENGKFTIFLLDGTIRYRFTFSKEGMVPLEEVMKLRLLPQRNERTITLVPEAAGAGVAGAPVADPAVAAYNEAAQLANEGKVAEAIAKMEEAVGMKADLTAGWMALAKLYARTEAWPKAIVAAGKVLEISSDEPDMFVILAEAYGKTGDSAKAKEFREKAPANPPALFNEAARLINGGNDKDAEPLLRQAISADDAFAIAHYELGMIYVRMGNTAAARKHLESYIAIDPNGNEVALAREMLKYLQ